MRKLFLILILLVGLAGPAASFDDGEKGAEFVFARVQFNQSLEAIFQQEAPWHHDYPYAEDLYLSLIGEFTSVRTTPEDYVVVQLDDDEIFKYPFLYFSEPGFMSMTGREEENLREFFDRGEAAWKELLRQTQGHDAATGEWVQRARAELTPRVAARFLHHPEPDYPTIPAVRPAR